MNLLLFCDASVVISLVGNNKAHSNLNTAEIFVIAVFVLHFFVSSPINLIILLKESQLQKRVVSGQLLWEKSSENH